jgi:phosphomannomutase
MTGHIMFADEYYGFDDGLYAAIRLIRAATESGETITDICDRMPVLLNTPELRFASDESGKFAIVEDILARLRSDGANVDDTDGVRVTTDDGWWLLRASNTQAELVARLEAQDEAGLERLRAALNHQLLKSGVQG